MIGYTKLDAAGQPVFVHRSYMPFEGMKVRRPHYPGEDVVVPEHLREGVRRILAREGKL